MKKILSMFLALMMIVSLLSCCGALTVSAAEAGTLTSNAIVLTDGNWYTKGWTNQNYLLNCYNKITIASNGYITFTATKPYDSEGEIGSYILTLYNASGEVVWAADTRVQRDSFSADYVYKIGLAAGTYYMNIDPSFYVYKNSATIYTTHKYDFTKSSTWEMENNGAQDMATSMTLGKTYSGVFAEEKAGTSRKDYYKVKLTKGNKYRFTVGNYAKLDSMAVFLIMEVLDPNGENVLPRDSKTSGSSEYWEFVAPSTGYYYPLLRNDGGRVGEDYTVKMEHIPYKASECTVSLAKTAYTYDGAVKSPAVTAKGPNGNTLKKGTDYTVTYASGRKAPGTYKVTVKFMGSYTGSKTLTFKINPISVDKCKLKLSATSYTYDGKVKTPTVSVKTASGKTLKKDTDYTVTYASGRKNAGTYKVTVKMKGNYTGSKVLTFKINPIKVDKLKLKLATTVYTYNGTAKSPSVSVKTSSGKTLKKGTDYTVTYASGRKNVGTYKVTIKMKGNYTGSKTLTFKINPPKTGVSKLTPGKKTIAVSITKKSSGVSGYQVQYSTSKSFANATTKTISSYNTTKYTIKSLKTGKTYYVRVRTFKTVNGKKVYSDWSAAKSAKVK